MTKRKIAIDLSKAPNFELDGLKVRPSLREIEFEARSQQIQPRIMQVLVVLARARGEVVSRDDLVQQCWDGAAVSEDALNRVTSKLRQLLRDIGSPAQIETIPRVGYMLAAPATASASGKATLTTRIAGLMAGPRGQLGAPAALAALALIAAAFLFVTTTADRAGATAVGGAQYRSIAVLPFDDLSEQGDRAYLTEAAADDIRDALARTDDDIRVSARASSNSLAIAGMSTAEIAGILNVDVLLEGAITNIGQQSRLSLTLVDPESGTSIWGHAYDFTPDQLEQIRSMAVNEVLVAINAAPKVRPTADEPPMLSAQASEQFLRANYFLALGDTRSLASATEQYLDLIEDHPTFAPAYAQLVAASLSSEHAADHSLARIYLDRAIELDPWSRTTLLAEQTYNDHMRSDGLPDEWLSRPNDPRRQSALDYSARLRTLVVQSKYREAEVLGSEILEYDPIGVQTNAYLARVLTRRGKPEQAMARLDQALQYHPGSLALRFWRVNALSEMGDLLGSVDGLVSMLEDTPDDERTRYFLSVLLGEVGFCDEAMALTSDARLRMRALHAAGESSAIKALVSAEMITGPPSGASAMMHLLAHDLQAARPWLERMRKLGLQSNYFEHPNDYKPYLALALRQAGEEAAAQELDQEILSEIERQTLDGDESVVLFVPYKALAAAARNDTGTLYDLLDQAADGGYTLFGLDDVIFDHLRKEPEFATRYERFHEIRSRQRREIADAGLFVRVRDVLARNADPSTSAPVAN